MSTTNRPTVTVCVVTYNQEDYIAACLESIASQATTFPFEVLVADDCSTDNTRAIVDAIANVYPGIVRVVTRSKNVGAVQNFIDVHNMADADYICHCDGDDVWLPGKLQKQAKFMQSHPEFSVTWHRMNTFDDHGNQFPGAEWDYSMYPELEVDLGTALRFGSIGVHSSIMYRREARRTRQPQVLPMDLFYTWEYLMHGRGKILDEVLGEYRISAVGSIRGVLNIRNMVARQAEYYRAKLPEHRRDIFIFALSQFLIDAKNRRRTALDFLAITARTVSWVSPLCLIRHLRAVARMKLPKPYLPRP